MSLSPPVLVCVVHPSAEVRAHVAAAFPTSATRAAAAHTGPADVRVDPVLAGTAT